MDWDVFICQVDVYCAALYGAESVLGMRGERRRTGGVEAGRGAVGSRCSCASLSNRANTHGQERKGEKKTKKENSATHD